MRQIQYIYTLIFFRFYTIAEVIRFVEKSVEEDTINSYDIVLHPPDNGQNSEQEPGDEELVCTGHFVPPQLYAPAELNRTDRFDDSNELHQSVDKFKKNKIIHILDSQVIFAISWFYRKSYKLQFGIICKCYINYFALQLRKRFPSPSQIYITMDNYFSLLLLCDLKQKLDVTTIGVIWSDRIANFLFENDTLKKKKNLMNSGEYIECFYCVVLMTFVFYFT